jgi:hypothetical protein
MKHPFIKTVEHIAIVILVVLLTGFDLFSQNGLNVKFEKVIFGCYSESLTDFENFPFAQNNRMQRTSTLPTKICPGLAGSTIPKSIVYHSK